MELNITKLFNSIDPIYYSASYLEFEEDVGRVTWENAMDKAEEDAPLLLETEEQKEAFREFVRSSGGWAREEVDEWDDIELNALCLQWIAGDMREAGLHADMSDEEWEEYEKQCEEGNASGRIFGGPLSKDGEIYFYIGV